MLREQYLYFLNFVSFSPYLLAKKIEWFSCFIFPYVPPEGYLKIFFRKCMQRNWVFFTNRYFFNPYIFANQCRRPWIFQTMSSVSSNIPSLTNRLASTIGGNRKMEKLCTTSQVSNITRETKFSHNNWHVFQD